MWSEMELIDADRIRLQNNTHMDALQTRSKGEGHDALLYITIVLAIYAISIVVLMVKYIRRERQEAIYDNYYVEFVKRDRFQMDNQFSKIIMEKCPSSGTYYGPDRRLTAL